MHFIPFTKAPLAANYRNVTPVDSLQITSLALVQLNKKSGREKAFNRIGERKSERVCYLSLLAEVPAEASSAVYGIAGCIHPCRATSLLLTGEGSQQNVAASLCRLRGHISKKARPSEGEQKAFLPAKKT